MNPSKNKLILFLGVLFLSFSCNKGDFDPTKCDYCEELMTCYEGVCDCDTTIADKFWDRCYKKYPSRFVCSNPDTSFGMTMLVLDSISYKSDQIWFIYEMYSNETNYIFFPSELNRSFPISYDTRILPKGNYDSIYMSDWTTYHTIDTARYHRLYQGKIFGQDSIELRIFHQNVKTYQIEDSSRVLSFFRR